MDERRLVEVQALIEPILAAKQVELVELTCRPHSGQIYVRLLVDKVGGITIRECAQVNQRISEALDAAHLIQESHTVEVSSPGLDRPLVSKRDFERAVGEDVQLEMTIENGRTKALRGMLLAVQPDAIVVKTAEGNVTVSLGNVRLAKKALRW